MGKARIRLPRSRKPSKFARALQGPVTPISTEEQIAQLHLALRSCEKQRDDALMTLNLLRSQFSRRQLQDHWVEALTDLRRGILVLKDEVKQLRREGINV